MLVSYITIIIEYAQYELWKWQEHAVSCFAKDHLCKFEVCLTKRHKRGSIGPLQFWANSEGVWTRGMTKRAQWDWHRGYFLASRANAHDAAPKTDGRICCISRSKILHENPLFSKTTTIAENVNVIQYMLLVLKVI